MYARKRKSGLKMFHVEQNCTTGGVSVIYNPLEKEIQAQLFTWFFYEHREYWDVFFHIPNGGSRHKLEAKNLKRQGVKRGVPDTMLAVARKGYHGLFLELKRKGEKPSCHQKEKMISLTCQGYLTKVADSLDEAKKIIDDYLSE